MGVLLNPTNDKFIEAVQSPIYIDKTGLIDYTNSVFATSMKYVCVSRPRRFGKSMTANMLAAYYSRGCDSSRLFASLQISKSQKYTAYLNKYDVIFLNMQEFLSRTNQISKMITLVKERLLWELLKEYPDVQVFDKTDLISTMQDIYEVKRIPTVFIIDEWDCVLREKHLTDNDQRLYLDFLRDLLKDKASIKLAYLTGILPIKKYGTHSALNMFDEFSMLYAGPIAEYVGFTESEVKGLCQKYHMDFVETKNWYDGYRLLKNASVYNPKSVVSCMQFHEFRNYWNQTETYEALKVYIDLNYDGLKDDILAMMDGRSVSINSGSFTNDMRSFHDKDDVMTLLVHLGYLGFDEVHQEVYIPNNEILNEFANAVRTSDWGEVSLALEQSQNTLKAIWDRDEAFVSQAFETAHMETAHLNYNDENALSYTISLALYASRNYYTLYRELPSGNGFADIVFIPKKMHSDKPALLVELKWNKTVAGAIAQIKDKHYIEALSDYKDNLLLVGINYDKKTRKHECSIELYK